MTTTNKAGMPEAFVNFVSNVRHNRPGTVSATTLLKGDKEIVLFDRHFDELEQDAADMVWAVFGTAVHAVLEKQKDDSFKEEPFECQVGDFTVTGRVDRYDMEREILEDWKTASCWKVIYKDFADWKRQGLVYAWLMKQANLTVRKCRFVALLKDHSKTKAKTDSSYPQVPVYVYEFPVTDADLQETEIFIRNKIKTLSEHYKLQDDEIPECSAVERWEDAPKFAVMKPGRKSAVKLFDDETLAQAFLCLQPAGCYVEKRPAVPKKCLEYCQCKEHCSFYRNYLLNNKEDKE